MRQVFRLLFEAFGLTLGIADVSIELHPFFLHVKSLCFQSRQILTGGVVPCPHNC